MKFGLTTKVLALWGAMATIGFAKEPSKSELPRVKCVSNSGLACVEDNYLEGLRLFVSYMDGIVEAKLSSKQKEAYWFEIPDEAIKSGEFIVWAVDSDDNQSEIKNYHALDGMIFSEHPKERSFRMRRAPKIECVSQSGHVCVGDNFAPGTRLFISYNDQTRKIDPSSKKLTCYRFQLPEEALGTRGVSMYAIDLTGDISDTLLCFTEDGKILNTKN